MSGVAASADREFDRLALFTAATTTAREPVAALLIVCMVCQAQPWIAVTVVAYPFHTSPRVGAAAASPRARSGRVIPSVETEEMIRSGDRLWVQATWRGDK